MSYPYPFPPVLKSQRVEGAKLYASRQDMVADLKLPLEYIAEVGVAFGDFSKLLLETIRPKKFVAFDLFRFHEMEMAWGRPTVEVLKGLNHLNFYRERFADYGDAVLCEEGDSAQTLAAYPDEYFDMIYVDGGHTYEQVKVDADNAKKKLKRDGLLIFNDYIMYDHTFETPWPTAAYGIVPVVNEIVVNDGWRVFGFALNNHMFCDIGISRRDAREAVATSGRPDRR